MWYNKGFIGVCCAEIGGRGVVQQIHKQLIKADTEQTLRENNTNNNDNNNDLLQSYLSRQAPGHTHAHTQTQKTR